MANSELKVYERYKEFARFYAHGKSGEFKPTNGKMSAISCGYSLKSAIGTASRLLSHPIVIRELQLLRSERDQRATLDAAKIEREISYLAHSDIAQLDGLTQLELSKLPPEITRAISSLAVSTTSWKDKDGIERTERSVRIKLHGKNEALRLGAQVKGIVQPETVQSQGVVVQVIAPPARGLASHDAVRDHEDAIEIPDGYDELSDAE